MRVEDHIDGLSAKECQDALKLMLGRYMSPAFGCLPKREVDLLVYETLERIGFVKENPTLYGLSQQLRVTRAKGRNLLYDVELRRSTEADLDARLRETLKHPILQKQGDLFALEIENPLVLDHLRSKLLRLHHATDGSFSASLVRITADAYAAVMEDMLPEEQRDAWRRALIKAGAPDTSLKGVLVGVLKKAASKVASDAGSGVVDDLVGGIEGYLGPIIDCTLAQATESTKKLFKEPK